MPRKTDTTTEPEIVDTTPDAEAIHVHDFKQITTKDGTPTTENGQNRACRCGARAWQAN